MNPGNTLILIGTGHCLYGLVIERISIPFFEIFRAGLVGQAISSSRDAGIWFHISGYFMILSGEIIRCYISSSSSSRTDRLPSSVAIGMIAIGVFGSLAYCTTTFHGFPLLIAQGIYMLTYRKVKSK